MSEGLQHSNPELSGRTGEAQSGVDGADVVLIGQVRAIERRDPIAMPPCDLCIHNVARFDAIAARFVLKQRRPLFRDVTVVHAWRQRVAASKCEFVLGPYIEGEVWRVGLIMPV